MTTPTPERNTNRKPTPWRRWRRPVLSGIAKIAIWIVIEILRHDIG